MKLAVGWSRVFSYRTMRYSNWFIEKLERGMLLVLRVWYIFSKAFRLYLFCFVSKMSFSWASLNSFVGLLLG